MITICAWCKQQKQVDGKWQECTVDEYAEMHEGGGVSHGMCHDCLAEHNSKLCFSCKHWQDEGIEAGRGATWGKCLIMYAATDAQEVAELYEVGAVYQPASIYPACKKYERGE